MPDRFDESPRSVSEVARQPELLPVASHQEVLFTERVVANGRQFLQSQVETISQRWMLGSRRAEGRKEPDFPAQFILHPQSALTRRRPSE